ncbi:hypothetical protein CBS101457_006357 [Exobasidium rhododendri]|nr:hypothetical protein CBS101457_006357 [Exobasidium rhododendri]
MIGSRFFLCLLAIAALARAERYTLHHRIAPSSSWKARGIITLETESPSPSYQDLTGTDRPWAALNDFQADSPHLYQLALTPEGTHAVGNDSPMTFARICLLDTDSDESITIHQRKAGSQSSELIGLSYDLIGLDPSRLTNAGCPVESAPSTPRKNAKVINIQVAMPEAPLSPLPPNPPPVKADGTPVPEGEEPPKEKSFVAKYWYYFVPILLLMAIPTELADRNNEDSEEGGGADNPLQAGGQRADGSNAVKVGGGGGARKR